MGYERFLDDEWQMALARVRIWEVPEGFDADRAVAEFYRSVREDLSPVLPAQRPIVRRVPAGGTMTSRTGWPSSGTGLHCRSGTAST